MASSVTQACQRKTSACAITSLVLLVGLLIFVVIHLTLSRQAPVREVCTTLYYLTLCFWNFCFGFKLKLD